MILIAIVITLMYLILIGSFIFGFDKVAQFSLKDSTPKTKFSIIIPFRNEAKTLPILLESLSKLNYPKSLFEIIFVNDESDDDSVEILNNYFLAQLESARYDRKIINTVKKTKSPKKDAITAAVSIARHDWIVTTDADCELPKFWLDSFDEYIQTHNSEFIIAPITYTTTNTFLDRFQVLDVLSLQGSTIGGFGINRPFLCNGGNLAYKKAVFNAINGFEGNTDIASGDDIFMLEKMVNKDPSKVGYLKCEECIVKTLPQTNTKNLISQRVRWAAKTSAYHNWFGKMAGVIVFLMNGGLLVFGLLTVVGILKLKALLYILVIKFGIDFLLVYKTASFFNQKEVLKTYFLAFFIYPLFSVYVVFKSIFQGYNWKGRHYTK